MSQNVNQRMREFRVRLALGAQAANLHWLVMRQGLRVGAVGIGIGTAVGIAASFLLANLLVGVSAADLTTWLLVPMILLTAVLVACWFPVRRALRSDPLLALRCE
jgi:ABC-type antimicrobial peptide transport system permease subunit